MAVRVHRFRGQTGWLSRVLVATLAGMLVGRPALAGVADPCADALRFDVDTRPLPLLVFSGLEPSSNLTTIHVRGTVRGPSGYNPPLHGMRVVIEGYFGIVLGVPHLLDASIPGGGWIGDSAGRSWQSGSSAGAGGVAVVIRRVASGMFVVGIDGTLAMGFSLAELARFGPLRVRLTANPSDAGNETCGADLHFLTSVPVASGFTGFRTSAHCDVRAAGRTLQCAVPPPPRACSAADPLSAARCAVARTALAQERYYVTNGTHFTGDCRALPFVDLPSVVRHCSTMGLRGTFVVQAVGLQGATVARCGWKSPVPLGARNPQCE